MATQQTCIDGQVIFLRVDANGKRSLTPVDMDAFEKYAHDLNKLGKKIADERTEAFRRAVSERFLDMLDANPELRTKVLNYGNDEWRKKALASLAEQDLKRLLEMEAEVRGIGTCGTRSDWLTRTSPKD